MPMISEKDQRDERAREALILERAEIMEGFITSPGWQVFVELVSEHSAVKLQELMFSETKTDADIYSDQRAKGHLSGLDWALRQPTLIIAAAQEIRGRGAADPAEVLDGEE